VYVLTKRQLQGSIRSTREVFVLAGRKGRLSEFPECEPRRVDCGRERYSERK